MEKGFTIIEIVISIFILAMAIVGIFSAFSVVTILTSESADRLLATYLAQEGIEVIRNIRDINWLRMDKECPDPADCSYHWDENLSTCIGNGCEVDYTTTGEGIHPVSAYNDKYLTINSDNFYGYTSGTNTKFKRKILITKITDVDGLSGPEDLHIMKVKVDVSWDEKATILNDQLSAGTCIEGKNCISAVEILYNWYNFKNQ